MSRLPIVSGQEAVSVLQRLGFSVDRQSGSPVRQGERGSPGRNERKRARHKELRPGLPWVWVRSALDVVFLPSLTGLGVFGVGNPPLKRWAIVWRP